MPVRQVRFDRATETLAVDGGACFVAHDQGLVGWAPAVGDAGLTSLRRALERFNYYVGGEPLSVLFSLDPPERLDPDLPVFESASLVWEGGALNLSVVAFSADRPDDEVVRRAAAEVLRPVRAELTECSTSQTSAGGYVVYLTIDLPLRGRAVRDALALGNRLATVVEVALGGGLDVNTTPDLIRAGYADLLVGLYENDWLEVKSAPYRLEGEVDRYELAKDVATFGNASGGLLLIGAKTKRRPDGDEIVAVNECRLADVSARKYRQVLRQKIFPALSELTIECISGEKEGFGVIVIRIPPQDDAKKPFLVHGGGPDRRRQGLSLTWAEREDADTAGPSIEVVHSLIRSGLAVQGGGFATSRDLAAETAKVHDAMLPAWISDIPAAARAAGFEVAHGPGEVSFVHGDFAITVPTATVGPPADVGQRQRLLERLADAGLPVVEASRGFLQPAAWR